MGDLVIFLPFLALFGVIIYMQTRQRKKLLARQADLQASLRVGAPIMLTCGLHGEVADLDEDTVDVEIAAGVVARFARAAVLELRGAEPTGRAVTDDDMGVDNMAGDEDGRDHDATGERPGTAPAKPRAQEDPTP